MSDISCLCSRTSSTRRHGLSWKFWRTLSFRRRDKFRSRYKSRDERYSDVTDYWRHERGCLRSDLPDVLEDAAGVRSDGDEHKSKRRSLFRSMSLIVSRHTTQGSSKRENCDTQIVRKLSTMLSLDFSKPVDNNDYTKLTTANTGKVPLQECLPAEIRATSPVKLWSATTGTGHGHIRRQRTISLDRSVNSETSHKLILSHMQDLLSLRLHPRSLMSDLYTAGLLASDDYLSTECDNDVTIETFIAGLSEDRSSKFDVFRDVLRNTEGCEDLTVILDVMTSVCDMVHAIPAADASPASNTDCQSVDENILFFDVGFLDSVTGTLMPVVKLKGNQERTGRKGNTNWFRLSVHSVTGDVDLAEYASKQMYQIPMVSVYLSGYNLHGDRCKALARTIELYECILELNVGKSHLGPDDFDKICGALRINRSISSLDVRLNEIGDDGAAKLAAVLRKSSNLRILNLSATGIRPSGCKQLCQGLLITARLRDLDFSFVDVGDEGCVYLSDMLTKNCSIARLRLRSTNIGWAGCALLFESLTENQTLEDLDISRNAVGNKGAEAMCLHLSKVTCLLDLNLENCGIKVEACGCLGSALRGNTTLRRLNLSSNYVGDSGVANVRSVITGTKSIECLGLNMCGVTTGGFLSLLEALDANKSINLLKLCYNRIGSDARVDADDVRFRLHCVKSSKPKLKLLLWGNVLGDTKGNNRGDTRSEQRGDDQASFSSV